jgi:hypothetical protein
MATRKVFIDVLGKHHVTPYVFSGELTFDIRTTDDQLVVINFSNEDSKELAMEIYKLKRQLNETKEH